MTTRVRSQLAYPQDVHFPICFLFFEITQGAGKREYVDIKSSNPKKNIIKPKYNQNNTLQIFF